MCISRLHRKAPAAGVRIHLLPIVVLIHCRSISCSSLTTSSLRARIIDLIANKTRINCNGALLRSAASLRDQIQALVEKRVPGALGLRSSVCPETVDTGIPTLDKVIGGIPRGALTEICGSPSSGRTTLLLSLLKQFTATGECCAIVDANNSFNPVSARCSGVDLQRLLWVKCATPHPRLTPIDKALQAADWIIHAGGFGMVALDLGDLAPQIAQRISLATWFRLRRGVESTRTALIVIEQQPFATSCASLVISVRKNISEWDSTRARLQHPKLLTGTNFTADVVRSSRIATAERKPPRQVTAAYRIPTSWAG